MPTSTQQWIKTGVTKWGHPFYMDQFYRLWKDAVYQQYEIYTFTGFHVKMSAMQIPLSGELSPFIKHYLFVDSKGSAIKKLRLFSDGNTGIVFSFNSHLFSLQPSTELQEWLPPAFLYGQITGFKDIYAAGDTSLVIIVFHPQAIHQIFGIPAIELRDKVIPVDEIFGHQFQYIQEQLAELQHIRDKVNLLDGFFLSFIYKNGFNPQPVTTNTLQQIQLAKGLMPVGQLTKITGFTERQIERKFIECVGLTPKMYSNIVKLHHLLKHLNNGNTNKKLTSIAYEAGYTDQSHSIKEFKKYTGLTPGEYIKKAGKLTNNFLELLTASNAAWPAGEF